MSSYRQLPKTRIEIEVSFTFPQNSLEPAAALKTFLSESFLILKFLTVSRISNFSISAQSEGPCCGKITSQQHSKSSVFFYFSGNDIHAIIHLSSLINGQDDIEGALCEGETKQRRLCKLLRFESFAIFAPYTCILSVSMSTYAVGES